jgi:hypothetical protein
MRYPPRRYWELSVVFPVNGSGSLTKVPTVTPAVTEGIEPVFIYPKVPPEAQRAPMMYAGSSRPFEAYQLVYSVEV